MVGSAWRFKTTLPEYPTIFANGFLSPSSLQKKLARNGQGLAIAWRIITELHGGKILVDSTSGLGTTFAIVLPIDARPNQMSCR